MGKCTEGGPNERDASQLMSAPTSDTDDQTTSQSNDTLDVNLLKEIAKKGLVDSLNSVRRFFIYFRLHLTSSTGEWCENLGS
jgi:hypothetical protein